MRKYKKYSVRGWLIFFAALAGLLWACGEDEIVEPAVFTPKQVRHVLIGDTTKMWQQTSRYYLEDSCRTGYFLRFGENPRKDLTQPFRAYFYRNGAGCLATRNPYVVYNATVRQTPPYLTSDTLVLVNSLDTLDVSLRVIRLLTSQQLQMDVLGPDKQILHREEYRKVDRE